MNAVPAAAASTADFCLCFAACDEGQGYAFPCDAQGHVDLDRLSDRARNDYLFARACVGHRFERPAVRRAG